MTIYEPNTIEWNIGDLVIHDADAKQARLLMRVIAKNLDEKGEIVLITEYIGEDMREKYKRHNHWPNHIRSLHDPKKFGIMVCGHTKEQHELFSKLSPEQQEVEQHLSGCKIEETESLVTSLDAAIKILNTGLDFEWGIQKMVDDIEKHHGASENICNIARHIQHQIRIFNEVTKKEEVKVADGTPTTNDGIPPNNKLSGILPTIL
jgi:hypothetical protein